MRASLPRWRPSQLILILAGRLMLLVLTENSSTSLSADGHGECVWDLSRWWPTWYVRALKWSSGGQRTHTIPAIFLPDPLGSFPGTPDSLSQEREILRGSLPSEMFYAHVNSGWSALSRHYNTRHLCDWGQGRVLGMVYCTSGLKYIQVFTRWGFITFKVVGQVILKGLLVYLQSGIMLWYYVMTVP